MSRKHELAKFINGGNRTFDEWLEFQKKHPWIRLKRLNAKGDDVVISLNDKGFIDPQSWIGNYVAGQKEMLRQAYLQLEGCCPQDEINKLLGLEEVYKGFEEIDEQVDSRLQEYAKKHCTPEGVEYFTWMFWAHYGYRPSDKIIEEAFEL